MSMHFAPQWVKPIKPSSNPLNASTDQPPSKPTIPTPTTASFPTVPFPALSSNGRSSSPNNPTTPNPTLSYSRVTHTPASPGFPTDGSYFPHSDQNGENGHAANPHPFRYSREQILGLWEEEKVRDKPIELMEMHEGGVILVSKGLVKPIGLRELSDVEKKLLATTVHPPMPTRRPMTAGTPGTPGTESTGTPLSRRTIGSGINGKDSPSQPSGRSGGFGFGRSENAFGGPLGGKVGAIGSGALGGTIDGRMPGQLGGGFGGVGRRGPRTRTESADVTTDAPRQSANVAWRPTRTTSGNFEGVLGFGSTASPSIANITQPTTSSSGSPATPTTSSFDPITHPAVPGTTKEKEKEPQDVPSVFGGGGGPGWGSGQKKWRIAAGLSAREVERPSHILNIPISTSESISESVAATASGTPVPERDASVLDSIPTPAPSIANGHAQLSPDTTPAVVEKEDLGAVQWYYRDPGGLEQGPFTGVQMQEWFSHLYFDDKLPLRRAAETSFHTLSELKVATASDVQPFLTAVRPRNLPPNLPLPAIARNGIQDHFSNLSIQSPAPNPVHDHRNAFPPQPAYQPYIPDHHAPFTQPYNQQLPPAPGSFMPGPGQPWGAIPPTAPQGPNRNNTFGSIGIPGPIGSAPLYQPQHQPLYSPVVGGPAHHNVPNDFYSPGPSAGIPTSPWGVPPQQTYQPIPIPQHPPPLPAWQPPVQEQPTPALPLDEPSYFPQTEPEPSKEAVSSEIAPEKKDEEIRVVTPVEEQPVQEDVPESPEVADEPLPDIPTPIEPAPTPKSAPVSVWGQKPSASVASSRKNSIAIPSATPSTATPSAKLPSSLPAKPLSATTQITASTPTSEKPPTSAKTAPWAAADKELKPTSTGPSLREIQEREAQQAEARKAAAARAAPTPSTPAAVNDDIPQNLTWGLPSSGSGVKSTPIAVGTPQATTPAAWGSGEAGPKKTMKQIQEEEEKRKAKARVVSAAAAQQVAAGKRGYADLAGNAPVAAGVPAAGWTTVGASVKASTPTPTASLARPVAVKATPAPIPKPSTPVPAAIAKPKTNGIDENTQPSVDFIRWTKTALTGLTVPMDDFIQMLLTFPIDPPASSRPEVLEIISDSVYANSSTLDGRRFAQEFFTRRKADAARPGAKVGSGLGNGLGAGAGGGKVATAADVVKIVPRKVEAEAGFKVVKAKGKKRN